jgi:predicted nuclease of restriction endonuclease-like RecB superfamily
MLTGDLAISFRRGNQIYPRLLRLNDANNLRDAANLIAIFASAVGKTRFELESELEEYVGTGTDYKILRGLIKLLTDRSEFATASVAEPAEVRLALFSAAKNSHPVLANNRSAVVAKVAAEFNCQPEEIETALYGDLAAQQKLLEFSSIEPNELIDRYNVAQAQALFYRCGEMKIWAEPNTPAGFRQIFSAIKYFKLIHSVVGNATNGYEITLNGAASIFHRSQKYGIQMAVFLPSLLNCAHWRMRAEIDLKGGDRAVYELTSEQKDLRSHYEDQPEYENPVHDRLVRDWTKFDSDWTLEQNREIVNLGRTAFIPDFVLKKNKEKVYLEILGFWTPNSLKKRLAEFQNVSFSNFIVAAWEELRGSREEPTSIPENVVLFKTRLEPQILQTAAEKITVDEGG